MQSFQLNRKVWAETFSSSITTVICLVNNVRPIQSILTTRESSLPSFFHLKENATNKFTREWKEETKKKQVKKV